MKHHKQPAQLMAFVRPDGSFMINSWSKDEAAAWSDWIDAKTPEAIADAKKSGYQVGPVEVYKIKVDKGPPSKLIVPNNGRIIKP